MNKPKVVPDAHPPPETLSEESAELWRRMLDTWSLNDPDSQLLVAGLEQRDTYVTAMAEVRRDGPTITNPQSGNAKAHPALAAAHAALRAWRQVLVHLDLPDPDDFRPRGSVSRRRRR